MLSKQNVYLLKYDATSSASHSTSDSIIKDTTSKWNKIFNFHFISRDFLLFYFRK